MKKANLLLSLFLCLTLLTACGNTEKIYTAGDVAGKMYTYEKEGFGGPFTISIYENGKFSYYVGFLSSYVGFGEWSVEDGVLTLKDSTGLNFQNHFKIGEDVLTFIEKDSTGVMYMNLRDGDRFLDTGVNLDVISSNYEGSGNTKYLVSLDEVRTLMLHSSESKVDRLKELLEGFTHEDLKQHWGEPDSMTSGIWSYAWDLDESSAVWVVFDGDGYVLEVHLSVKE